jgi:hypothetical protein
MTSDKLVLFSGLNQAAWQEATGGSPSCGSQTTGKKISSSVTKQAKQRRASKENKPLAADLSELASPSREQTRRTRGNKSVSPKDGEGEKKRRQLLRGVLISPPLVLRTISSDKEPASKINTSAIREAVGKERPGSAETVEQSPKIKTVEKMKHEENVENEDKFLKVPSLRLLERSFDMSGIVENIFAEEQEEFLPQQEQQEVKKKKKKVSWGDETAAEGLAEWRTFRSSQSPVAVTRPPDKEEKSSRDHLYVDDLSLQLSESEEEEKSDISDNGIVCGIEPASTVAAYPSLSEKEHEEGRMENVEEQEVVVEEGEEDMFGATLSDSLLNMAMDGGERRRGSVSLSAILTATVEATEAAPVEASSTAKTTTVSLAASATFLGVSSAASSAASAAASSAASSTASAAASSAASSSTTSNSSSCLSSSLLLGLNTMSSSQFVGHFSHAAGNSTRGRASARLRDRSRRCDTKKKVGGRN